MTTRTDRFTDLPYNKLGKLRSRAERAGERSGTKGRRIVVAPAVLRIELLGRMDYKEVALRAVSAACQLVTQRRTGPAEREFQMHVRSAVAEVFNNIVIHAYAGRDDGIIQLEIQTRPDQICVELRDWGTSFDPSTVAEPDLESLPETGLGMYIVRAFMRFRYRAGKPNILTLTKTFGSHEGEA